MKTVADYFFSDIGRADIPVAPQSTEKDRAVSIARAALRDPTGQVWTADQIVVLARQYLRALGISEHG